MKKLYKIILFLTINLYSAMAIAHGLTLFADVLNWRASESTSSSWSSDITFGPQPPGSVRFTPENINFNWNRGFRTGIGYESECPFWNSTVYWTHYSAKTTNSASRDFQILVPEFFSGFLGNSIFISGSVNWQIAMDTIDIEGSHPIKLSESFVLRPTIGIKAARINQTINAIYDAVIYTSTERVKNDFTGVGPTFGLQAVWNLYDSLNLVASFSTAYMWGNWNTNDTYVRPSAFFVTPTTINTNMNHAELGTMMFDYLVGLECVHPKKSRYTIKIGYEMQSWSNQLRISTFQQLPEHGDLTFQGAVCRLSIDL